MSIADSQMHTQNEENLVKKNRKYARFFDDGDLSQIPAKKYAIVTCMDCRIEPAAAFGIDLGDAHVIRNAGGSAREALRHLVFSNQLLGTTQIFVIKHTHCGLSVNTNETIVQAIVKNLGEEALADLNGLEWYPSVDVEQGVKDDVAFLKASKAIPKDINVSGWVYDVETGKVKPVAN